MKGRRINNKKNKGKVKKTTANDDCCLHGLTKAPSKEILDALTDLKLDFDSSKSHELAYTSPEHAPLLYSVSAGFLLQSKNLQEDWKNVIDLVSCAQAAYSIQHIKDCGSIDGSIRKSLRRADQHTSSMQAVVLHIAKHIPCNCLDELKQRVLLEPELRRCQYCNGFFENVYLCSKCDEIAYCSQECQTADWPEHTIRCKFARGKISSEEYILREERRRATNETTQRRILPMDWNPNSSQCGLSILGVACVLFLCIRSLLFSI